MKNKVRLWKEGPQWAVSEYDPPVFAYFFNTWDEARLFIFTYSIVY